MALDHQNIMKALDFAGEAHKGQTRKGTDLPYVMHPYQVGIAILQHTFEEDLTIAGILHDTLEDTPVTIDGIREVFGDSVADIVLACSEPDKTLSWEERKQHTIEYLKDAPEAVKVVACADKYHNILTMIEDKAVHGDGLWERFNRGQEQQEWYYRGLVDSLGTGGFSEHSLFIYFKMAVESLFGNTDSGDVGLLMTQLNWLRGQCRLGMLCFVGNFQNDVSDLASLGENIQIMVSNPITAVVTFYKELYEQKVVQVGLIDRNESPLLLTEIEDRVCRFVDTFYQDILNMVHQLTCANLGFIRDVCENEDILQVGSGHYAFSLDADYTIRHKKISDNSQGELPVSIAFECNGNEIRNTSELPRYFAQSFLRQILSVYNLNDLYSSTRDRNGFSLSKDIELTPEMDWVPMYSVGSTS